MAKLVELESVPTDPRPTLVILEATTTEPEGGNINNFQSSPDSLHITKRKGIKPASTESDDIYGMSLLKQICAEISAKNLSRLVVPIAMITNSHKNTSSINGDRRSVSTRPHRLSPVGNYRISTPKNQNYRDSNPPAAMISPQQMMHCMDSGALDVLTSPLQHNRLHGLVTLGYRAHKETARERAALLATARLRKRSWVGFEDKRPYAYLREEMYVVTGKCPISRTGQSKAAY